MTATPAPEPGAELRGRALARAVVRHVLAHPERHNQGLFVDGDTVDDMVVAESSTDDHVVDPLNCRTTACLAGWTVIIGAGHREVRRCVNTGDWEPTAVKLLYPDTRRDWRTCTLPEFFVFEEERAIDKFAHRFEIDVDALADEVVAELHATGPDALTELLATTDNSHVITAIERLYAGTPA